ncbi:MAG: hypothetical protein FJ284_05800 [Planctomycetes bacterium]|nr:hypothetical protein [Planctomycetota bacterium]
MDESFYRAALGHGRIRTLDVDAVLTDELGERASPPLAGGRARLIDVQRALLLKGLRHESDTAVRWTLTESDTTQRLRDDLDPSFRNRLLASGGEGRSPRAMERRAARKLWRGRRGQPHRPRRGIGPRPAEPIS